MKHVFFWGFPENLEDGLKRDWESVKTILGQKNNFSVVKRKTVIELNINFPRLKNVMSFSIKFIQANQFMSFLINPFMERENI